MLKSLTKKTAKVKRFKSCRVLLLVIILDLRLLNFSSIELWGTLMDIVYKKNANLSGHWRRLKIMMRWNLDTDRIDLNCICPRWSLISKNTSNKWISHNSPTSLLASTTRISREDSISSIWLKQGWANCSKGSNAIFTTALLSSTNAQLIRLARRFWLKKLASRPIIQLLLLSRTSKPTKPKSNHRDYKICIN